jgi:hypothetical protein
MLADEGAAAVFLGKAIRRVEGEPQRGDMGAQRVIGDDRLLDQIRTLRLDTRVEMRASIAVRPAIEAAVLHRGHVIGHEGGAELVPFVDDGPQRAAFRLKDQAVACHQALGPMVVGGAARKHVSTVPGAVIFVLPIA